MGFEVLEPIINAFKGLSSNGISYWLAWVGLGIIAIIGVAYAIYGLIKLGKIIASLRIKEFTLMLLIVGLVLVGLAVLLP